MPLFTVPGVGDSEAEAPIDLRAARRCALARIEAARQAGQPVSALVTAAAESLGVGVRTVWRWLDVGLPGEGPARAWLPSDADLDAYIRWKGNAAAAWRERRAEAEDLPSLRSFQEGLVRVLGPRGPGRRP